jgi:subtilisin family serine protease
MSNNTNNTEKLVCGMLKLNLPVVIVPTHNTENTGNCTAGNSDNWTDDGGYHALERQPPETHRRYIITFREDVEPDTKTSRLDNLPGFRSKHKIRSAFRGCTATVPRGLLMQLMDDPEILIIEQDTLMHQMSYSAEPEDWGTHGGDGGDGADGGADGDAGQKPKQLSYWHQSMTNTVLAADDDFSTTHCYVLDTGILPAHTEFTTGQVVMAYNAINRTNRAQDDHGHGTGVASMIGGKTVGVAAKTKLHSIKVLDSSGSGYTSDIIAGLNWVMERAVKPCVVNMSLGGNFSSSLNTAVQTCINRGISVICAAGNDGKDASIYSPANNAGAITVAAHDILKTKPTWSNFGGVVDTFAPGVSVRGAWGISNTMYYLLNGTSFASPIVAGIVCRYLKSNPAATVADINGFLGRVNLANEIANTGSTTTPNLRLVWNTDRIDPC